MAVTPVFLLGIAPPASIPVALDVFGSNLVSGAVSVIDVSLTVASHSNRALVALVANDNTLTFNSVAYTAGSGGTWAKLGTLSSAGNRECEIWSSVGPSTGAVTIRATSSANAVLDLVMGVYSVYNVDQTTPVNGYASEGVASVTSLSTTLTAGGMIVGMCIGAASISPIITGTSDFSNVNNDFWEMGHNSASGTLTWTTPSNGRGINICNIKAA